MVGRVSSQNEHLNGALIVVAQIRIAFAKMAFPGMSAPGLSGDAGMDEQKLKEQQMIKFVRPSPVLEQVAELTKV
jgi:hypothetical protein